MPRKASVIMTMAEKKAAAGNISTELAAAKAELKTAQADAKAAAKQVKELTKKIEGLKARKSTLAATPTRKADKQPEQQPLL